MSSEVSLSSVDFDEIDRYYGSFFSPMTSSETNFHEKIFVQGDDCRGFTKTAVLQTTRSKLEEKTKKIACSNNIKISPMMGKVSSEVGVTYEWGGETGSGVSGHASASASDDKGNKVEVNSDGSGSATVSASRNEK